LFKVVSDYNSAETKQTDYKTMSRKIGLLKQLGLEFTTKNGAGAL